MVDVDILLKRQDLEAAKKAMADAGFHFAKVLGVDMFLDGDDGRPRDAVHLHYAEEIVRQGDCSEGKLGMFFSSQPLAPVV